MKRNFTREEIEALILDLGSDDQEVVEFAINALMMANPRRHLSDLIDALLWSEPIIKQRICYILGGVLDDRCIDPLLSMLNEPDVETQLAAIDSLQFFPVERIIPPFADQLQHSDEDVRDAIVATLGVFIKHGVLDAHLPLIDIIRDENESIELRRLALMNLQNLEDDELIPLLESFKNISDASIYSHVLLLQDDLGKNRDQKLAHIERLIQELLTESEILKQIRLEDRLVEGGSMAARALIQKIFSDPDNTALHVHARMILEKMGLRSLTVIKWLVETFDRFDDSKRVFLLQDLITLIAQPLYASLAQSLVRLLQRINTYIQTLTSEDDRREFDYIKSDIHFALATYDCRDAVADMKAIMRDGTERQHIELIEALVHIGSRDFLIPLINQLHAYRDFSQPCRRIKQAFKAIVKREKIKRNDPLFNNLSELQKENLGLMMKK